jgi:tetratricopeptide (TPR) repeat protein
MYRIVSTSLAALAFLGAASAQVFVVGGGLARECFDIATGESYNFRLADETCSRALREETMTRGNRAATYVNRGVMRMRDRQFERALSDYDNAISIVPDLGAAFLNQGAAHIYRKDFSPALISLNKAIELQTDDLFAAHYNRAIARENTGDVPGAYHDFQKALELKPGWSLAERQLSRFYVEQQ